MAKLSDTARDRARSLRVASTDAERALWSRLRARQLAGAKFRRQLPIPPWTADFACVEARLVVELDGGQHAGNKADVGRDADLAARGWRVLRFWNHDVPLEIDAVARAVLAALEEEGPHPHPLPPAAGEGA